MHMLNGLLMRATQSASGGDWDPTGHAGGNSLWNHAGAVGAWLLLALFLGLVLVALLRRARYRAVDALGDADREALKDAVMAAEKRTVGELVVVVLERSDRHPQARWLAALSTLLLGSALLSAWLPWDAPLQLILCQLALGALGFASAALLPDFARHFVSPQRASEMAGEQALLEFTRYGLTETDERTGVLLFLSLFEHRAVVIGDRGINAVVPDDHWTKTIEAVLAGVRAGRVREGLEAGIERCSDVLAEHFPWREGDRDELENHVVVRSE